MIVCGAVGLGEREVHPVWFAKLASTIPCVCVLVGTSHFCNMFKPRERVRERKREREREREGGVEIDGEERETKQMGKR